MPDDAFGAPVRRVEDPPLLTGRARYTDDLEAPEALHAVFVRAVLAHGELRGIDVAEAAAMPGVVAVLTAADLDLPPMPAAMAPAAMARPVLARDRVRFIGEAVAIVVAATRAQAVDAAELVDVDVEPLDVLVDASAALDADAPVLFADAPDGNLAGEGAIGAAGALADAEVVIRHRFVNQRLSPVPMEPPAALAVPDEETGGVLLRTPCQSAHTVRDDVAGVLGLDLARVRVWAPAVGGGFGTRIATYPEQVAIAALALRLGRPVRYVETRSESMLALEHGRAQVQDVALGARSDATLTGLELRIVADCGAYPASNLDQPELTALMACGVYRLPRLDCAWRSVVTTTTPVGAYRGAGRPEATALLERAMDLLAAELELDPAELRRRNLIPPSAFPYATLSDASYDSGDYPAALERVLEAADYPALRAQQAERRAGGGPVQLGIGLCAYVEWTGGSGSELGTCSVGSDGRVTVRTGTSPHGQGHETVWAQLVAGTLGVAHGDVTVVHSDTARVTRGGGTMASRSLQLGGSAVRNATEDVLGKGRELAAHLLEAPVEDIVVFPGEGLGVAGSPGSPLPWARLAGAAADPGERPAGWVDGLAAEADFAAAGPTYPFGAHVAVVEVDVETGHARLVRHVTVDDAGRIANPLLAEGQIHGGIAQGVAQALFEGVEFDADGNCLTANLVAYAMPSAPDLPVFETQRTETPTPRNPLGAKGIGESGTIGSTPAVWNAVVDAVSHLGVRHVEMPATAEKVWRAIREAAA